MFGKHINHLILCSYILFIPTLNAQIAQPYKDGQIHEAYITKVSGDLILTPAPTKPPEAITEKIPRQLDMQAEWIPGYWTWDLRKQDFVWTSGVWRRPPPGHQWISGFWKHYDEGWVWVSGFWSRIPEHNLEYIGHAPPDPIDENTAPPPTQNYFWVPGYWLYDFDSDSFKWVKGKWEELDPQWILVPTHYVWRPGGYVMVPGYWDWTLEDKGTAYAPILIPEENRANASVEPSLILRPKAIVQNLFLYYPDYLTFYQHYSRYHPEFWQNTQSFPPWWEWDTWWCFSWHDQWALWWWYTHPGYVQPSWMTKEISGILPPPSGAQVVMMEDIRPPAFVTPDGVVTPQELLGGIKRTTGRFLPIFPDKEGSIRKIYRLANADRRVTRENLRPNGRRLPINPSAIRPNVRKPIVEGDVIINIPRLSDDRIPRLPFKPKIPSHQGRSSVWNAQNRAVPPDVPTYTPPIRRPTWSPRGAQNRTDESSSSHVIPGSAPYDDPVGFKRWRQMKPYSEPVMSRPPIHKEKPR